MVQGLQDCAPLVRTRGSCAKASVRSGLRHPGESIRERLPKQRLFRANRRQQPGFVGRRLTLLAEVYIARCGRAIEREDAASVRWR